MAKPKTTFEAERFYHIWTNANGFENLFNESKNYYFFLDRYRTYLSDLVDTYAYCLMPNHLHLMIKTKDEKLTFNFYKNNAESTKSDFNFSNTISNQFSKLFNSYTQSFNKLYQRKGSLFIPNFNRKAITNDAYFTWLVLYIHKNPVHHGFCQHLEQWKFSSYRTFLEQGATKIKRGDVLDWFGGRSEFIKFHKLNLNQEIINNLE
ncbi:hypothetical protein [Cecembia sp.]|uniref:hypothetical protein n=1 Tax=Cecembia sp. TaxID=1898110 RepID=UPI0025C6BC05|nr:hypothetical protein [Cecembia sp.]